MSKRKECWAACLGDCSETISGEHIVSGGSFTDESVKVKGLPWCADEFKTIGLAGFVKNVLCRRHNSRLSPLDEGATQLRKAPCDIVDLSAERGKTGAQSWPLKTFCVNGLLLERWCLKTLIAIAIDGEIPIGDGDSGPGTVPRELVEIAFGSRRFEPPCAGLSWLGNPGEVINVAEGVVVATFSNPAKRISGARFVFWGLGLLLMLTNDLAPGGFVFNPMGGGQVLTPTVIRRPQRLGVAVRGVPSHELKFEWPPGTA